MYLRLFYFSKTSSYFPYSKNNFLPKSVKIFISSCFSVKNPMYLHPSVVVSTGCALGFVRTHAVGFSICSVSAYSPFSRILIWFSPLIYPPSSKTLKLFKVWVTDQKYHPGICQKYRCSVPAYNQPKDQLQFDKIPGDLHTY